VKIRSRSRGEQPVLITEAPPSPQAAFDYRRRRYALTMAVRVLCLILAAVFYRHLYVWPVFAVGALVLPWIAVVLANDQLRAKPSRFQRFAGLTSSDAGLEARQRAARAQRAIEQQRSTED
jgi:DUF3099 family protein